MFKGEPDISGISISYDLHNLIDNNDASNKIHFGSNSHVSSFGGKGKGIYLHQLKNSRYLFNSLICGKITIVMFLDMFCFTFCYAYRWYLKKKLTLFSPWIHCENSQVFVLVHSYHTTSHHSNINQDLWCYKLSLDLTELNLCCRYQRGLNQIRNKYIAVTIYITTWVFFFLASVQQTGHEGHWNQVQNVRSRFRASSASKIHSGRNNK